MLIVDTDKEEEMKEEPQTKGGPGRPMVGPPLGRGLSNDEIKEKGLSEPGPQGHACAPQGASARLACGDPSCTHLPGEDALTAPGPAPGGFFRGPQSRHQFVTVSGWER